jgi:hypothetical protein
MASASASMRGTAARRYWALGAVLFTFVLALFLSFQTLFEQKRIIEQDSRVNLWFLAQTELEFLNLMETLAIARAQPNAIDYERLVERFELFWSRLPILLSGTQSENSSARSKRSSRSSSTPPRSRRSVSPRSTAGSTRCARPSTSCSSGE